MELDARVLLALVALAALTAFAPYRGRTWVPYWLVGACLGVVVAVLVVAAFSGYADMMLDARVVTHPTLALNYLAIYQQLALDNPLPTAIAAFIGLAIGMMFDAGRGTRKRSL